MIKKPLPRSSGIGRAAKRERGSAHQPGFQPRLPGSTSNEMPTLSTKPIPWANPLHLLCPGISVKMWRAELVLTAAVRCALLQEEGQAP